MLGICKPSLTILRQLLKSFSADMTLQFFFLLMLKFSGSLPGFFHVAHIIFQKHIIIFPFT